ncbi:hypothetical protein SAMN04488057_10673 [Cyclobacterium lianum]|uniref:DUF4382 domain-containing protein n=1 Tax=Cyclobacterium lianum TaxID=388280 RepID=A0A1M7NUA2_9BACT|nr:hypothetical protein [Cyclobacterium lianum]SHN07549.1 hypothetical protein SAMN04488057_10673 [Cyclobacterium lianum]
MLNVKKYCIKTALLAGLGIMVGCQDEASMIPGTGEGRMGLAFVLGSASSSQPNARSLNTDLEITEGFIQIRELELEMEGRDENGEFEKEHEVEFDEILKVTFDQFDESRDFFFNIPEGEYEEIELELDLIDYRSEPSIYLEGTYANNEGNPYQFVFEYYGDEIDFEVEIEAENDDDYFRIDRVNNPLVLLELNSHLWFSNISKSEFEEAESEEGIIRISNNSNRAMFSKIVSRIEASSEIEVELR